jgi:hypothetical protein
MTLAADRCFCVDFENEISEPSGKVIFPREPRRRAGH